MIRPLFIVIIIVIAIGGFYIIDPAFNKTVEFNGHSTSYEWRIFNNYWCNHKTAGHCYNNETNKLNAEILLYQKILSNYNGQTEIKTVIENVVSSNDRFRHIYSQYARSSEINFDTIIKYKNAIFKTIVLK